MRRKQNGNDWICYVIIIIIIIIFNFAAGLFLKRKGTVREVPTESSRP